MLLSMLAAAAGAVNLAKVVLLLDDNVTILSQRESFLGYMTLLVNKVNSLRRVSSQVLNFTLFTSIFDSLHLPLTPIDLTSKSSEAETL